MSMRHTRMLLLGSVVLIGCQVPDLSDDLDTFEVRYNDAQFQLCNCPEDVGLADEFACTDARDLLDNADVECMAGA